MQIVELDMRHAHHEAVSSFDWTHHSSKKLDNNVVNNTHRQYEKNVN
jgi:hypothetical protein